MKRLLCLVLSALVWGGCEEDSDLETVGFSIDPPGATLSGGAGEVVILTAVGGEEPLNWTVSDADLGVVTQTGRTVTYARTVGLGGNTVTCTDSRGWTASALILQVAALSVTPAAVTLNEDDEEALLSAVGGIPPYAWRVRDADRGAVAPVGANQAIYTRLDEGNNTVYVSDSLGATMAIAVTQPAVTDLAPDEI